MYYFNKNINPREAIEYTIQHYQPDISDEVLLNTRESIMQRLSFNNGIMYVKDYFLYTRKKFGKNMNVGGGNNNGVY